MQASQPVRLGRKRTLPSCPNPMFLKWLTELRDEAREKGQKTQYTYQKVHYAIVLHTLVMAYFVCIIKGEHLSSTLLVSFAIN